MLRSPLLVIGHLYTVDVIRLVMELVGRMQKHRLLKQALPSLFHTFARFSLPPPPLPFVSATQARSAPALGAKNIN